MSAARRPETLARGFMAGQPSGAKDNASETQGNPSGGSPPSRIKNSGALPGRHGRVRFRAVGVVIPLCFNTLAWFTYGGDFLWRTSRITSRNRSLGVNQ